MPQCPGCASDIGVDSRFCPECGVPLGARRSTAGTTIATMAMPSSSSRVSAAIADLDEGRFLPGTLLADRYRIVGQLGKGGMGEVYRATDLRLAQTVALKFLPETAAHDPALLARFYNEVRIARQITHPNVCRVYDLGEFEGVPFISMQFVDGENLGSLLTRIGRLPVDKGVEIVRRLCAGLAAAHAQGVLHRDLKPANIMIDGRGQVLIMDFGLAGVAEEIRGADIRSGTPAYMSPEQLAGAEVTVQSDIYALGLVMYEIFAGRRAWEAESLADLIRLRNESRPAELSSIARDIDPAVERIILRCLEPDRSKRPPTALAVSAALPGGDPLAAALAAGETPSPEMVAAAGSQEAMQPWRAVACLAAIIVLLATIVAISPWLILAGTVDLQMPPDALAVQARRLIHQFGYTGPAADSASGFDFSGDYIGYLYGKGAKNRRPWPQIANLQPSPIYYWYRQSPTPLEPINFDDLGLVTPDDPQQNVSGMALVALDPYGRLMTFSAVPPQVDKSAASAALPDAAPLFSAAGLDMKAFHDALPEWVPTQAVDARAAWSGTLPHRPELPVRVEAAWWRGRPVYFDIVGPWSKPWRMQVEEGGWTQHINRYIWIAVELVFILGAALLAWRNHKLGRGDRQGAYRLAVLGFTLSFCAWILKSHFVATAWLGHAFVAALSDSLGAGFILWLAYLALEPAIRRRWPHIIIGWTRLLSGKWRDPMVGRDLLYGVVLGLGLNAFFACTTIYDLHQGGLPQASTRLDTLLGFPHVVHEILRQFLGSFQSALSFFLIFFVLRMIVRRDWLAVVLFGLLFSIRGIGQDQQMLSMAMSFVIYAGVVTLLLRFGLLPAVIMMFLTDLLVATVFTTHFGAWYGTSSLVVTVFVLVLALFGFRKAMGPQRLLAGWLEE